MSTPHLPPEPPAGSADHDEPTPGRPAHDQTASAGPRPGPGADGFFDAVRRVGVSRSDDRWVGGVAAGVAERFGIDPLLVRGILFVTFFLSGAGFVLYGLAWALLPERSDGRIHAQEAVRGNFDVALLGAIPLVIVGFSWQVRWLSWWDYLHLGWLNGLFWVAAIVTVAIVAVPILNQRAKRGPQGRAPGADAPVGNASWQQSPVDEPWGSPTAQGTTPVGTYPVDAPRPPYASTHTSRSGTSATPPVPPVPPVRHHQRPPRSPKPPRAQGPGAATTGIVVGLSLLAGAFLLVVDRAGDLPWPVFLTWAGASVVLAGIAIVVSGLRGRTSGGLGWLATIALLVAVPTAAWQDDRAVLVLDDSVRTVSDGTHRVTDPEIAEDGFGVRWGDPTIDLSDLDLTGVTAADPVEIPVQLGAGDVTVVVPDRVPVRADVQVWAGSAQWNVDGDNQEIGGISSRPVTFTNEEADAGAEPLVVLLVDVGAGQAIIEEN
ncbi:PspC domain-containing protein [Cellulosimicrobium terreum]|nr:PspC domain-containing protein [Cellulosimicrobium terreum]